MSIPTELNAQLKLLEQLDLKGLAFLAGPEGEIDLFDPYQKKDFINFVQKIQKVNTLRKNKNGIHRYKVMIPTNNFNPAIYKDLRGAYKPIGSAKLEKIKEFVVRILRISG